MVWYSTLWTFHSSSILQQLICTLLETNNSTCKNWHPKRNVIFQPSIFMGYVKFRGCKLPGSPKKNWSGPKCFFWLGWFLLGWRWRKHPWKTNMTLEILMFNRKIHYQTQDVWLSCVGFQGEYFFAGEDTSIHPFKLPDFSFGGG